MAVPDLVRIGSRVPAWMADAGGALLCAGLAAAVFLGSLDGAFVYDDARQIRQNTLIQTPGRLGAALASDVWAFKGERAEAWSNYWRPTFVLWLAANWRLFGDDPRGWHAGVLLLHATATALGFALLRVLQAPRSVALAAAIVFAAHPAHVESVAWISGATDPLLAVFALASLILALVAARGRRWAYPCALVAAALALLAKEVAVALPVLAFAAVRLDPVLAARGVDRRRAAARVTLPLLGLCVVYFLARWHVLGRVETPVPWRLGPAELLATSPSLAAFYLRQALVPWHLGPSYALRAVSPHALGAGNFFLPVLLLVALGVAVARWARGRPLVSFGLVVFVAPLLPALNVNAFLPEHLVHDRYLYLPLLGLWAALAAGVHEALSRRLGVRGASRWLLAGTLALALPLAARTHAYARAWESDVSLWRSAVWSDPGSAFNWAQLGDALLASGKRAEAGAAAERALAIAPATTALFTRASLARLEGRLEDARRDLERILAAQPDNALAYEHLARVHFEGGHIDAGAAVLEAGMTRVPYRRCAFGSNLAVVRYRQGRKAEALAELEGIRGLVGREPGPACTLALFHLGSLYAELGKPAEARRAYLDFLAHSDQPGGRVAGGWPRLAREALARLGP